MACAREPPPAAGDSEDEDAAPPSGSDSLSMGDVLAEVMSRQLAKVDPMQLADARIDTLLDLGANELSQVLDSLDSELDGIERNTTALLRAEMDAATRATMQAQLDR